MTSSHPQPEPWWHARSGALVALAIALGGGWLADARTEGGLTMQASRMDREVDMLERRLAALERRCESR